MQNAISSVDLKTIRQLLSENPSLANEGLPYSDGNSVPAHPLHRICDGIYEKRYSDEDGVEMATLFLACGADINGNVTAKNKDTPLVAACSLHADLVALFLIQKGADLEHPGCHGGTPLHWAAWCGRDVVVSKLLERKVPINKLCDTFKSTPLFWAFHGFRSGEKKNRFQYTACIRKLMEAGADRTIPNFEGYTVFDLIDENDIELKKLLEKDKHS
ncbi:MAG TPA: ankyrin repeat domain-containing protein [Flavitalea sp.]|nr:ankyrin repeat domain-containing protein [Flavitalea sp.]